MGQEQPTSTRNKSVRDRVIDTSAVSVLGILALSPCVSLLFSSSAPSVSDANRLFPDFYLLSSSRVICSSPSRPNIKNAKQMKASKSDRKSEPVRRAASSSGAGVARRRGSNDAGIRRHMPKRNRVHRRKEQVFENPRFAPWSQPAPAQLPKEAALKSWVAHSSNLPITSSLHPSPGLSPPPPDYSPLVPRRHGTSGYPC